jgi:diguanylate cyclase (GGDEF)-like protein
MKLDFLTLYIVILLNSMTVVIIWGAIAYRYRTFTTARIWLLGCVLTTVGGGVLALQGNEGSYVPAVVGNGFVIFGFCLFWTGIRHFYGVPGGLRASAAITAMSLIALLPLFDSVQGRNLVYATGQSVPLVLASWYLLREKRRELGAMIAAFAMIVGVVGHALESGLNIGLMAGRVDATLYTAIESYVLLCVIFSGVVWNFGFAVMSIDRLREELSDLAHKDDLTGAPNRRRFLAELEAEDRQARRSALPFSLLLIDIDRFKQINDTNGHAFGDRVLRRFVEIVQENIRSRDTLFRLGGDEFSILLPGAAARQAEEVASRLVVAVRSQSNAGARSVRFTISVGVAEWSPGHSLVGGELMMEADGALYKAKEQGRDGYAIAGLNNLADVTPDKGRLRLAS